MLEQLTATHLSCMTEPIDLELKKKKEKETSEPRNMIVCYKMKFTKKAGMQKMIFDKQLIAGSNQLCPTNHCLSGVQ